MDFRILGPLDVRVGGESLPLRGAKQKALLAALLVEANRLVSTERLTDLLWQDDPPDTARNVIQVYVSQLRKIVHNAEDGRTRLTTRSPGYVLEVEPESIDAARFVRLADDGHEALIRDRPLDATRLLDEALTQWRGDPLADFEDEPFAEHERQRLRERRLVAEEDLIDARLACGASAALVPDLESLVVVHPFRERLRGQLVLALYRAGRQADALAAYRSAAECLADELGIDPGPVLQALHAAVLRQDASLAAPAPPTTSDPEVTRVLEPSEHERVMVTVVAARPPHHVPSESFDPEVLFAASGSNVAQHPDGLVVAAFGFPDLRDDHAERAALAALAAAERGWAVGIATGKPVTATLDDLAQLATTHEATSLATVPGEVQLSDVARRRLSQQFDVGGASGRVLIAPRRRLTAPATPLVGRDRELAQLERLADEVESGRGRVVLVEGTTGVGKSRLLDELGGLVPDGVAYLRGTCGIGNAGLPQTPIVNALVSGTERLPLDVLPEDRRDRYSDFERGAIPPSEDSAASLIADIAESIPTVLAIDDIQAIDTATARALTSLVTASEDLPLMVVLTLGERGRGKWHDLVGTVSTDLRHRLTSLSLEPLTERESEELADALSPTGSLDPATRAEVVTRSGGNPLFIEQLVLALLETDGLARGRGWTLAMTRVGSLLPTMLEDVLAVRVQRLGADARLVAQACAVVGDGAGRSLISDIAGVPDIDAALSELAAAEVLTPAGRTPEATYRFHHQLLRDATLSMLTPGKARDLHARAADALEKGQDASLDQVGMLRYRAGQWESARAALVAAAEAAAASEPDRASVLREMAERAASHVGAPGLAND